MPARLDAGFFEQRHAALGGRAVGNRGERRDLDRDHLGRILGERRGFGDDHSQRLADIADLAGRDHRLLERDEGIELLLAERNGRHLAEVSFDVGRRDHGVHARACTRCSRVDRNDAAMGNGAAQDHRMELAGARDIVDILALAAQEPQILDPLERAADEGVRGAGGGAVAHGATFTRNAAARQPPPRVIR